MVRAKSDENLEYCALVLHEVIADIVNVPTYRYDHAERSHAVFFVFLDQYFYWFIINDELYGFIRLVHKSNALLIEGRDEKAFSEFVTVSEQIFR